MSYILSIDTSNFKESYLELRDLDDDTLTTHVFSSGRELAEKLVPEIDALIKRSGIRKLELIEIKVHPGPGSFTSTRIGVSVANAIAFALHAKVNDSANQFVDPVYEQPANITLSEKLTSELDKRVE